MTNHLRGLFAGCALCVAAAVQAREVVAVVQDPVNESRTERGTTLIDFGSDAFGWLELDVQKGDYVVRVGEKLDASGYVDMDPGGTIRSAEVRGKSSGSGFARVLFVADERNTRGRNGLTHAYPIPEKSGVIMPFRYVEAVSRR